MRQFKLNRERLDSIIDRITSFKLALAAVLPDCDPLIFQDVRWVVAIAHQIPKIEDAAYARGHDEGRSGQAMLELAGRDRFIRELVCRHCGRRQGQTIEDTDA